MRLAVVGGGPGGLYFAALWKSRHPRDDVRLVEESPADATSGFGVARTGGAPLWKQLVALACLALLSVASASAGADDDALIRFGLLGTWAVDCTRPPSNSNPYLVFAVSRARYPTRALRMGGGFGETAEMRDIRVVAPDRLAYLNVGKTESFRVTLAKAGARFYSYESVGADGVALIKDGKFVATGRPTPVFERCSQHVARSSRSRGA